MVENHHFFLLTNQPTFISQFSSGKVITSRNLISLRPFAAAKIKYDRKRKAVQIVLIQQNYPI